jgi:tetratricopeptide (TPR) repeat protein
VTIGLDSQTRVRTRGRTAALGAAAVIAILALLVASLPAEEDSQKVSSAATLIRTGRPDEAEALLWDVLTRHPENAEALNLLGSIRLQQKRYAESETLLRRAISLAPNLLPARTNLSRVYHAQGETDKELSELLDTSRLAPGDAEINCDLAAVYVKQNDYHQALETLERIPHTHRPDAALPLLEASYLGLGRVAEARSLTPVVATRAAKNPELPVEFANVLLDFDLVNDALSMLETAQKQQAPSSQLYFAMGRARQRNGEIALAQKDFRRAVDLNPTSVDALLALARLLANQGQWEKSVELLGRARTVAPNSPEVLRKFAAVSLHAGHPANAVEAAQQLVKLRPDEAEAVYLLGVAQLQSGDAEEARSTLDRYIELRPKDPLAFLALGMVEANLHDLITARANFEQSLQLDPNQAEVYYQLALIFREQGDNRSAISQLEKSVAADARRAQVQALLGTLYLSQQDYAKAEEHLTRAETLAPDSPDTHYQLGLLFARLNDRDRAQREMAQFRKLKDKEHPGAAPPGDRPATSAPPYPPS